MCGGGGGIEKCIEGGLGCGRLGRSIDGGLADGLMGVGVVVVVGERQDMVMQDGGNCGCTYVNEKVSVPENVYMYLNQNIWYRRCVRAL